MEELENTNPGHAQDIIDRKAIWVERMFDKLFAAVQQNPFATMLILSVGLNFWQYNINNEMNKLRIQDITVLNEKINAAVEKGVQAELNRILTQHEGEKKLYKKKSDTVAIIDY